MSEGQVFPVHKVTGGRAAGAALVARARLSAWGGYDPRHGLIVEQGHPLAGESTAGRVLILISTRGSSATASYLSLARENGTGPVALVNTELDPLAALAGVVCDIPLVIPEGWDPFTFIHSGDWVEIDAEAGTLRVRPREAAT